jgi:hypothetical protein
VPHPERASPSAQGAALAAVLLGAVGGGLIAQEPMVTLLVVNELAGMPGKEALMIVLPQ